MKAVHGITRSALALSVLALCAGAQAQISDGIVKIGVLTDMAGPYSGMGGAGSVVAARMAIDECLKAECKGMKIELVSADHQNKADIAATKARFAGALGCLPVAVHLLPSPRGVQPPGANQQRNGGPAC